MFANSKYRFLAVAVLAFAGLGLAHAKHLSEKSVEERIKPVAKVYVEGDAVPGAAPAAADPNAKPRSGEEVYTAHCAACHASGAAGAPKFADKAAWAPRIAKGEATLLEHAIKGFNAMPPKGMCMTCSDDEIKGAVAYMTAASK